MNVPMREAMRFLCLPTSARVWIGGAGEPVDAIVEDVSHSGLRMQVPVAIAVDASVRVEVEKLTIDGTIRYCRECETANGQRFVVGMQFSSVSDASPPSVMA
jgi:hypothetical protein